MTIYYATVSAPGCLSDSDVEAPVFDNAREAWEYLADERGDQESDPWADETQCRCVGSTCRAGEGEDSPTLRALREAARKGQIGSIGGPTVGRCASDEWDLGRIYSVTEDDYYVSVRSLAATLEPASYAADGTEVYYCGGRRAAELFDLGRIGAVEDYHGDQTTYGLSNARSLQRDYPDAPWTRHGDALALPMNDWPTGGLAIITRELADVISGLWDEHPIYDEDDCSELENEMAAEQIRDWVTRDISADLGEDDSQLWDARTEDERELLVHDLLCEIDGCFPTFEGTSLYIHRDDFADLVKRIRALLHAGEPSAD